MTRLFPSRQSASHLESRACGPRGALGKAVAGPPLIGSRDLGVQGEVPSPPCHTWAAQITGPPACHAAPVTARVGARGVACMPTRRLSRAGQPRYDLSTALPVASSLRATAGRRLVVVDRALIVGQERRPSRFAQPAPGAVAATGRVSEASLTRSRRGVSGACGVRDPEKRRRADEDT